MIDIVNYAKDKNQGGNTYNYTRGSSSSSSSLSFVTRDEYSKLQTLLKMFEPGYFDNNVWTPISNVSGLAGRNWSIKALRDLWGVGGMTALGTGGSGGSGGGGDASLGNLLNSLKNSQAVGSITPGQSQAGQVLQFDGSDWSFVTVGSSELSGVVSVSTGTGLTGGPITSSGTISINDTYQGYIQKGVTAYGWGDHSQAGYLTSAVTSVKLSEGTGIDIDSTAAITSTGERTISINSTYQGYITQGVTAYGWGNHAAAGYQPAIGDLTTIRSNASMGATAYGWGNHAEAGYAADNAVVHKDYAEEIIGVKTFSARLNANNNIYLGKTNQQQWIDFNNGLKHFDFGQEGRNGDCVLFSPDSLNFYTNVNNNPYALYVQGSSGNVGIGVDLSSIPSTSPSYKLRVNGDAYASGRIWSGLSIGAKTSETEGFRFEWDANNNAVVVVKADGTPCNFYSMGGVSALGVGAAGATPSISAMNIGALTVIEGNDGDDTYSSIIYQSGDILNIEADSSLDISGATSINGNTSITGTLYVSGTTSLHDIKVGSSGSVIKSITWNSSTNRLDVVIGSNTYSFQPVS